MTVSVPLFDPVYVKVAVPLASVVALPEVAFGPVTVNATLAPEIGVAVGPLPFFRTAVMVWVVPLTLGPAEMGLSASEIGWGLTVIVTFDVLVNCESFAASCRT